MNVSAEYKPRCMQLCGDDLPLSLQFCGPLHGGFHGDKVSRV
jgi:hypothetical protein